MTEQEEFEKWRERIKKAENAYKPYHELCEKIRKYYKNDTQKNKSNIFWSSIETLKPFLYFKTPKVYVERKSKQSNPIEAEAANILDKALGWDLEQFDFDSVIKYARNDYLLLGSGVLYEKYKPSLAKQMAIDGTIVEVLDGEQVETAYIDPVDFIADSEKVGVWEECQWVARIVHMTKEEVVAQFGKELEAFVDESKKEDKNTKVYEIWDKPSKTVLYICKDFAEKILKRTELPDLTGGFPMPKPIFCTLTNDSLIPVPDYTQIKEMLNELDGINDRMRSTIKAIKVSGCYDNSFSELANILAKENELISVSDFDKLRDHGGLAGIIDFMPIGQYVEALAALAQQREGVIQQIYEITGVSDIMRGNSDPAETATAVNRKTNFGTLRNQDRQNDMQRFITDLLKIKAEMICEIFQPETLAQFASEGANPQIVEQAIQVLRMNKTRDLIIGIETDTSFNQDEVGQKTIEAVQIVNDMVTQAFQFVSAQPLLLPLYKQMVQSVVGTLPNTRQFEPVIDEVFNNISQQLAQPSGPDEEEMQEQEKARNDMDKNQIAAQKNQQDFAIKQEQNQIKREELAVKKQIEEEKLAMANKEAEMQKQIADEKLALGLQKEVNANITTGYVKGF